MVRAQGLGCFLNFNEWTWWGERYVQRTGHFDLHSTVVVLICSESNVSHLAGYLEWIFRTSNVSHQNIFQSHELPLPPYFGWLQPQIFHLFCVNSSFFHHFSHFSRWKSPSKRRPRAPGLRRPSNCGALPGPGAFRSMSWTGGDAGWDVRYTSLSIYIYIWHIYMYIAYII